MREEEKLGNIIELLKVTKVIKKNIMMCKIMKSENLMCPIYMKSTKRIKSQKNFDFIL